MRTLHRAIGGRTAAAMLRMVALAFAAAILACSGAMPARAHGGGGHAGGAAGYGAGPGWAGAATAGGAWKSGYGKTHQQNGHATRRQGLEAK